MDDEPYPFRLRVVTVAPGTERAYREAEWRDALVVLEDGNIDLVGLSGVRHSFHRGAILWLEGLPLRGLANRGDATARLVAVSRQRNGHGDGAANGRCW